MADPVVEAPTTTPEVEKAPAADAPAPDEDCSGDYTPVVQLAEVETKSGEEDEEVIFKIRSKLFRFNKELGEWKERGTGDVRLLKHKESKKIRLLMRREKTLKICLNHYVNAEIELSENVGSDRSWVWHAIDYADGTRDEAMLAIRFRDSENANLFKEAYDKAAAHMKELLSTSEPAEAKAEQAEETATADATPATETAAEDKPEEKSAPAS